MASKEYCRLILYLAEWVLSVICLGLFPSSLYRTTKDAAKEKVCAIGSPGFCRFGIAWTLLGVLILTVVIIWHLEEYCTAFALPVFIELCFLTLLVIWWTIAAFAFLFTKTNEDIVDVTSGSRRIVRVSAWILVGLFISSAVLSWKIAKSEQTMDAFNIRERDTEISDFRDTDAGYREYI